MHTLGWYTAGGIQFRERHVKPMRANSGDLAKGRSRSELAQGKADLGLDIDG